MNVINDTFIAPPCKADIDILFQDENILLISKPSGLLSLSGKNPLNRDSVHFRLVQEFPTATLTHRLDFGTSGVMLVALNKAANANITQQFQLRSITKTYKAVLHGHLDKQQGVIDLPIAKDAAIFPRLKVCHQAGKSAITHYKVDSSTEAPDLSVVTFEPKTGRTHQLRIHSQAIGHPIIGCDLYGNDITQSLSDRLMLHAQSLNFKYPLSGEPIQAVSPCPF